MVGENRKGPLQTAVACCLPPGVPTPHITRLVYGRPDSTQQFWRLIGSGTEDSLQVRSFQDSTKLFVVLDIVHNELRQWWAELWDSIHGGSGLGTRPTIYRDIVMNIDTGIVFPIPSSFNYKLINKLQRTFQHVAVTKASSNKCDEQFT